MKLRKVLGAFLVVTMFISCFGQVYATASTTNSADEVVQSVESNYMESRFQINFTDMNLEVSESGDLIITEKTTKSSVQRNSTNQDTDTLEQIFEEFPEVEDNLVNDLQSSNGELYAVSFTSVPLMEVDGHYERVPVSNARGYESSDSNGKGKFLFYTTISGGTVALAGEYRYIAKTYGSWSNNLIGGSDYPDGGDDYVFQTCPNTFARQSDTMSVTYDTSPTTGVNGDDYWRENGDSTYVRYAIQDDPLGYRQSKSFTLSTTSAGPVSSNLRLIGSYYVHTWTSMTLDVSVDVSSDKSVTLSLDPGNEEKSWQVYNYVSFDF